MKALELAGQLEGIAYSIPTDRRGWTEGGEPQNACTDAAAELRRLTAVEVDCAPYLKEGETPAERIKRALGDADSLLNLYRGVMAERDALKAELEHTIAECRDAYPVPEVGSELEGLWGQAMGDPASVGAYVKACATSQQKEIDELKAENERLLAANLDCIAHYEDARAELERIKALEPVAYARFTPNGNIRIWARTHAEAIAGNLPEAPPMTALYALGSKTNE